MYIKNKSFFALPDNRRPRQPPLSPWPCYGPACNSCNCAGKTWAFLDICDPIKILRQSELTNRNRLASDQDVNSSSCDVSTDDLCDANCDACDACDECSDETNERLAEILFHEADVVETQSSEYIFDN